MQILAVQYLMGDQISPIEFRLLVSALQKIM